MAADSGNKVTRQEVDELLHRQMDPDTRHYLCHLCLDMAFAGFIEENPHITGFLSQPISALMNWSGRKFQDRDYYDRHEQREHDRQDGAVQR